MDQVLRLDSIGIQQLTCLTRYNSNDHFFNGQPYIRSKFYQGEQAFIDLFTIDSEQVLQNNLLGGGVRKGERFQQEIDTPGGSFRGQLLDDLDLQLGLCVSLEQVPAFLDLGCVYNGESPPARLCSV